MSAMAVAPSYAELHCHSAYSFLDGVSLPDELAARAHELGYEALALTDHNSVSGSMELALSAEQYGLRAIHGAEIDLTPAAGSRGGHLTLLVKDDRGWRDRAVFRQALCDRERILLALSARLALLPAPAATLGLSVECFGPPAGEQLTLLDRGRPMRASRLREAVAQVRAAAGPEAALRAVFVDPDSRVPERRAMLAPLADR